MSFDSSLWCALRSLPKAFPSGSNDKAGEVDVAEAATTFRPEFYEVYKLQAMVFDEELKEYNKELNVTLFFVSSNPV